MHLLNKEGIDSGQDLDRRLGEILPIQGFPGEYVSLESRSEPSNDNGLFLPRKVRIYIKNSHRPHSNKRIPIMRYIIEDKVTPIIFKFGNRLTTLMISAQFKIQNSDICMGNGGIRDEYGNWNQKIYLDAQGMFGIKNSLEHFSKYSFYLNRSKKKAS